MTHYSDQIEKDALKQRKKDALKQIYKLVADAEKDDASLGEAYIEETNASKPVLILNALQTPDGTILRSLFRHDYKEYVDANGKTYMVDGGLDYVRRSNNGDENDMCLYDDAPHDVQRQVFEWGTYGINGDQPLTYVCIADMDTSHLNAIINTNTMSNVMPSLLHCMETELSYRENK